MKRVYEFYKDLVVDFYTELTPHGIFFIIASLIAIILISLVLWIDNMPFDQESKTVDFLAKVLKADGKLKRRTDKDMTMIISKLFEYCNAGNIKKMRKLLEDFPDLINASYGKDESSLLHIAINNNDRDLAVFLVEKGAELEQEDVKGHTALDLCHDKVLKDVLLHTQRDVAKKDD